MGPIQAQILELLDRPENRASKWRGAQIARRLGLHFGTVNGALSGMVAPGWLERGNDGSSDWFRIKLAGTAARLGCKSKLCPPSLNADRTLREMQSSLPWTGHYHRDFRASPMTHKDLGHALLHVHKAGGRLAAIVNDAEHGGVDFADGEVRGEIGKYLADLVICALRMANTCPDGVLDLQRAVEHRIAAKNNQLAGEASGHRGAEKKA